MMTPLLLLSALLIFCTTHVYSSCLLKGVRHYGSDCKKSLFIPNISTALFRKKLFRQKCLSSTHTLGNDIRKIKLAASNAYHLEDVQASNYKKNHLTIILAYDYDLRYVVRQTCEKVKMSYKTAYL